MDNNSLPVYGLADRARYPLLTNDEYQTLKRLPPEFQARRDERNARSDKVARRLLIVGVALGVLLPVPLVTNGWMVPGALAFTGLLGLALGFFANITMMKGDGLDEEWRDRYLQEIGYGERLAKQADREKRRQAGSGDGDRSDRSYPVTGNYDPQRYYGYSRSERDVMKALGIDGDTYDSNMRD